MIYLFILIYLLVRIISLCAPPHPGVDAPLPVQAEEGAGGDGLEADPLQAGGRRVERRTEHS